MARLPPDFVRTIVIKRTIKFADAAVEGEPILRYAKDSEAAQAYRELAQEIIAL